MSFSPAASGLVPFGGLFRQYATIERQVLPLGPQLTGTSLETLRTAAARLSSLRDRLSLNTALGGALTTLLSGDTINRDRLMAALGDLRASDRAATYGKIEEVPEGERQAVADTSYIAVSGGELPRVEVGPIWQRYAREIDHANSLEELDQVLTDSGSELRMHHFFDATGNLNLSDLALVDPALADTARRILIRMERVLHPRFLLEIPVETIAGIPFGEPGLFIWSRFQTLREQLMPSVAAGEALRNFETVALGMSEAGNETIMAGLFEYAGSSLGLSMDVARINNSLQELQTVREAYQAAVARSETPDPLEVWRRYDKVPLDIPGLEQGLLRVMREAGLTVTARSAAEQVAREAEQRARLAAEAEIEARAEADRQEKIGRLVGRIQGVQEAHRQAVGLKGRSTAVRSSVEVLQGNLQAYFGEKGLGTRVAEVRTYVDGFTGEEDASQKGLRSNLKALEDQKKTILETRRRLPAILGELSAGISLDGLIGAFEGDVGLAELLRQAEQGEYVELVPGSVEAVLGALEGAVAELTRLGTSLSLLEGPTGEVERLKNNLATWRRQLTELEELKAQLESRPKRSYEAADVVAARGEIQTKFRDDFAHLYGTAYQSDAALQDQILTPWACLATNIPDLLKTFNPRAYGEAADQQAQKKLLEGADRLIDAQTHVTDDFKDQAHRDLAEIKARQRPFVKLTTGEVDAEKGPILERLFKDPKRISYVAEAFAGLRKNRPDLYGNEAGKLSPDRLDEVVRNCLEGNPDMPDILSHPDANDPDKVRALLRNSYEEYTRVEKRLFELKSDLEEAQGAAQRVIDRKAAESGKTPIELKKEEASKTDEARAAEKADLEKAARVDALIRDLAEEQQKTELAAYKLGKQVSEMASLIAGKLNKAIFKSLKKVIHPDKARLQEAELFSEIPKCVSVIENDLNARLPELLIAEQVKHAQVRKAAAPVSTIVCEGAEGSYVVSVQRPRSGQTVEVGRIVLKDAPASISRRHIALQHDGTVWQVADLNSANGTYLNGVQVEKTPVTLPKGAYLNMAELYFRTAFDADGNLTLTQVAMDDVPVISRRPLHRPVAVPPSPAGVPGAQPRAEAPPRRALYAFAFDPTPGEVFWLGSARHCEAPVHSMDINPEHLSFAYENGHWVVQDLGTVSGSRCNGRPIGQGEGKHGEWITLNTNDILEAGGIYFKLTITGRGSLQVIEVSESDAETVLAAQRAKAAPQPSVAPPHSRAAAVSPPAPVVILRGNVDVNQVPVKAYPATDTLGSFAMATSQGIGYTFELPDGREIEVNQDGVAWIFDRDGNLCLLDVDGMGGMGAPHVVEEATQIVLETFAHGHGAQPGFVTTANPYTGLKLAHDRVDVFNLKQLGNSKAAAVAVAAHILNPTAGQTKHHVQFYASGDPEGFLLRRNPDGSLRILHGIEKHEKEGNPTKGLGMSDAKFAVSDSGKMELQEGDIVLVGSDCLTKVYGEDIAALLPLIQDCNSAEEVVRVITEDAHTRMRRGGRKDNFSVGIYLHLLGGAQVKKQARSAAQGAGGSAAGQAQPKAAAPRPRPAPQARPRPTAAQPEPARTEPARPRPVTRPATGANASRTQVYDISDLVGGPAGPARGGTGAGDMEGKPVQVGTIDPWLANILGITIAKDAVIKGNGVQASITVKDPRKIKFFGEPPTVILTQGRQQVPLDVGTGARFLNVGDTIQVTYDGRPSSFKIDFAATGGGVRLNLAPVPGTRPKR